MDFHGIDEGPEYFEENVMRKCFDCDLSVKLAYAVHTY